MTRWIWGIALFVFVTGVIMFAQSLIMTMLQWISGVYFASTVTTGLWAAIAIGISYSALWITSRLLGEDGLPPERKGKENEV